MIQDTVDNILVFEQEWDQQIRALRSKNARDPRISVEVMRGIQVRPIRNLQKIPGQIVCGIGCEKGPTLGGYQETVVIAVGPDVLDAGGVVEGLGGGGWRRVRRVRRVGCWFLGEVLVRNPSSPGISNPMIL